MHSTACVHEALDHCDLPGEGRNTHRQHSYLKCKLTVMERGTLANEEGSLHLNAVASFVRKGGDDALLHMVAEYLVRS